MYHLTHPGVVAVPAVGEGQVVADELEPVVEREVGAVCGRVLVDTCMKVT